MLTEIHCEKFGETPIPLHSGLNVVVGDSAATNSIGKSSFLMVIDFMMGGDTFIDHNSDVVDELGHHKYFVKYRFGSDIHSFCRETGNPEIVFKCTEDYQIIEPITLNEYREFLNFAYHTHELGISFRSVVSTFCRIWGKENLNPKRPLDAHKNTKALDALNLALHLYQKHKSVEPLEQALAEETNKKSALQKAQAQNLIPKITAKQFKENEKTTQAIDDEISQIKTDLLKYATNIRQLASKEVTEIKQAKDMLIDSRSLIMSRLRRVSGSLENNSYIKSKCFAALKEYFPQMDVHRLAQVEEFHSTITKILKKELVASKSALVESLDRIDAEIACYDERLSCLLNNLDNPGLIVDRVHALANKKQIIYTENNYREKSIEFAEAATARKNALYEERKKQLALIQVTINDAIQKISDNVYGRDRRCPYISFSENNYVYEIFEDTGTGRAYSNLILFDLAVFMTSVIPTIIHDSLMFKNVENEAVSNIVAVYDSMDRQVFIAIDEIEKYGKSTVSIIDKNTVLRLSDSKVLYVKDWRKKLGR